MSARSGSARSRARSRVRPAAAWSPSASRAIASSSRAATTQDGWTPTRETEPSRTGALAGVQPGQGGFGAAGFTQPYEGLQHVRPRRRREEVRRDEPGGQPLGGLDVSQRLLVTATSELEQAARIVEVHPGGGFGLGPQGLPGALEPPLCLRQPALADHHAGEYRVGDAGGLVLAP